MIRRKIIVPIVLTTVLGGAFVGTNIVQAYNANPFADLAQMMSQKFSLDPVKVQAVLDQYKTDQQTKRTANMKTKEDTRLNQLVTSGKITADQKQQIIDEQNLLKTKYNPQDEKGKMRAEIKTLMAQRKADIDAWSKTTGLDSKYLTGMMGEFGRGFRGGFKKGTVTPTPAN